MVVFYRSTCDSTTPSHQHNQLLSSSIAFPKPNHKRPSFSTLCRIGLDQPLLPPACFPLSMAPTRPSPARSSTNWSGFSEYEVNVILSAPQFTSSSFFFRRRCERRNRIFGTTAVVRRVRRDPGFRGRQH
jgi:hypothetical protein